jgi:acyl carrier protein
VDQVLHKIVDVEYKNCSPAWKKIKADFISGELKKQQLIGKLKKINAIKTHCNEDDVKAETLLKDIKADSLHWVQIIVGIESATDVEIDFDKMKEIESIDDLVTYIDSLK